jgi:phage virion morphogenesis protein
MIDGAKTRVDNAAIRAALERLRLALPVGGDMTPAFRSIGRIMQTGAQLRFREERDPAGNAWEKSKRAIAEGGKTLQDTRRLRNSITYEASHDQVAVGTNVVYGAIHQHGGRAGRGHKLVLPAREYLGVSETDEAEILRSLNDHLSNAWRG